jgi:hypothetical protein
MGHPNGSIQVTGHVPQQRAEAGNLWRVNSRELKIPGLGLRRLAYSLLNM